MGPMRIVRFPQNLLLTSVNPFGFISSFLSRLFHTGLGSSLCGYVYTDIYVCNLVTECQHDIILMLYIVVLIANMDLQVG